MASIDVFVAPEIYVGGISSHEELYHRYQDQGQEDPARRNYNPGYRPTPIVVCIFLDFLDAKSQCSARIKIFQNSDSLKMEFQTTLFFVGRFFNIDEHQRVSSIAPQLFRLDDFVENVGEFVTLLPIREEYYRLADFLGRELAVKVLGSVNDISALNLQGIKKGLLERAMHASALAKYLQFDNEAFLSYMSLGRIYEKQRAGFGPPPPSLDFVFRGGEESEVEFQFDFGRQTKGAQSINAIIGPNGVGKTRALLSFAEAVTNRAVQWPGQAVVYTHDPEIFRGRLPRAVKIVNLSPTRRNWRDLTRRLVSLVVGDGLNSRRYELLDRLLSDVLPLERVYVPLNLNAFIPDVILREQVEVSGKSYVPFSCVEQGRESGAVMFRMDMPPLVRATGGALVFPSSGEMSIFLFLTSVLADCDKGSLLLIDEPENHLHPQFISLLMRNLGQILLDTDSLAVIATHSPYVVRELDKRGVTIMVKVGDHGADLYAPTLQTHGANVSEISSYVFDDMHIRKGFEAVIDSLLQAQTLADNEVAEFVGGNFGGDGISYFLRKTR